MYLGNLLHLIWDGLLLGFPFLFGVVVFRFMTLEFVSCGACHIDDGTEEYHPLCLHPRIPSPHIIALLFDHSHVTDCSVDQTTQTTVNGPKQQTTNIRKFSRLCLTQNFFRMLLKLSTASSRSRDCLKGLFWFIRPFLISAAHLKSTVPHCPIHLFHIIIMPSNNLASLLSLASASSRIRESQHPQITYASRSGSRTLGFTEPAHKQFWEFADRQPRLQNTFANAINSIPPP